MNQIKTIAVLGGGGRTGKFLISKLTDKGYRLRVLLRNPENFEFHSPLVEIAKGDATNAADIDDLLKNSHAVVSTIGQRKDQPLVAFAATCNILEAMTRHNIRRYILVGGINIDTPHDKKSGQTVLATDWMKAQFPLIHEDRQRAYSALMRSSLDWTLTRVPMIEFTEAKHPVIIGLQDCMTTKITAGGIANFLVEQLTDERYYRQAPFIGEEN
jgi:putative NADH-flavin reductase